MPGLPPPRHFPTLPKDYFDYKIVRPHLIICSLLILALIVGATRWVLTNFSDTEVLILNVVWAVFNLVTLGAAVAVGREARQLRGSVRLGLVLPGVIHLPSGRTLVTQSRNLSTTGGMFSAPRPDGIALDDIIQVELPVGERMTVLPARVVAWEDDVLRVSFDELTLRQQRDLVRIVLCRADAWLDWEDHPVDRPMRAVREIMSSIGGMFVPRRRSPVSPRPAAAPPLEPRPPTDTGGRTRERVTSRIIAALGIGLGALAFAGSGFAQNPPANSPANSPANPPAARGPTAPGAPPTAGIGQTSPAPLTGAAAMPPQGAQVPVTRPTQMVPGAFGPQSQTPPGQPSLPGPAGSAAAAGAAGAVGGTSRQQVLSLKDLGANSPLRLIGVQGEGSLPFSVRRDEVVTGGKIDVSFAYSPALIPELSHLTVLLNGEVIGSIPLPKEKASGQSATLAMNPVLFQRTTGSCSASSATIPSAARTRCIRACGWC